MISSIVLFFRRARDEVGPVVEAPRLAAAVPFWVVPVAAGVAGFAPPRMELLAGAAVLLAPVVALVPKGLAVLAGSDVAALVAGLLRPAKRELGWVEAVVAVLVESAGLFRVAKRELEAAVEEAIGAGVLAEAAVESLLSVGFAAVVLAPPMGPPAGFAAVASTSFAAWAKREEASEEAGAAALL